MSHNGVVSITTALKNYPGSVTYVDLSSNSISRGESPALRDLIQTNKVLRVLGLGYNNLSSYEALVQLELGSPSTIDNILLVLILLLGMMDNKSLVLVPLVGNLMSPDALVPLKDVQKKLRENRSVISSNAVVPQQLKMSHGE